MSAPTLRIGIDLCAVEDVADAMARFGDRYLRRVYTEGELADSRGTGPSGALEPERLAGRFAVKEAAVKVLQPEDTGIDLRSIEVERGVGGWTVVHLGGTAAQLAAAAGLGPMAVSLTHERGMAAAVAVAHAELPSRPAPGGEHD